MTDVVSPRPAVDRHRLWRSLMELAGIGATAEGGVSRVALTPEDRQGRRLVERWLLELGCELRTDAIGNLFARLRGREEGPALMIGSHLDSQPNGGRFDGALGVLCGLEVLRAFATVGEEPRRAVELAIWTDEEGARFDVSCIGSSVYAHQLPIDEALSLRDADGVTFAEALDALEWSGTAPLGTPLPAAYFELHIEQGPVLDDLGVPIGIVKGIPGIRWHELIFKGATGHAGATPYAARRDALLPAAAVVTGVDALGRSRPPHGRGTTCKVTVEPNAGSVVAGEVRLLTDLRHPQEAELDRMENELRRMAADAATQGHVDLDVAEVWRQAPVTFHPSCVEPLARAAEELGLAAHRMPSGAGHDAGPLASVVPTGMVFVPCAGGVSHHPAERVEPEDAAAGARVLLRAAELWMDR